MWAHIWITDSVRGSQLLWLELGTLLYRFAVLLQKLQQPELICKHCFLIFCWPIQCMVGGLIWRVGPPLENLGTRLWWYSNKISQYTAPSINIYHIHPHNAEDSMLFLHTKGNKQLPQPLFELRQNLMIFSFWYKMSFLVFQNIIMHIKGKSVSFLFGFKVSSLLLRN